MDKRGQGGLSMNTIVVAIVAIIVLLLIVTFVTGGLGTIGQKITDVFKGSSGGYERDLAIQNCRDFCETAKKLPSGLASSSAYCKQTYDVDGDPNTGDGGKEFACKDIVTCQDATNTAVSC